MTNKGPKRLTAKEAADAAAKYYQEVSNDHTSRLVVSEVELENNYWYITLGVPNQSDPFLGVYGARMDYKIFKVNAVDGEVVSMKIRKIE